jgi:hypothetical protein
MIIDIELFEKIQDQTGKEYDFYQMNNKEDEVMVTSDVLLEIIKDLIQGCF